MSDLQNPHIESIENAINQAVVKATEYLKEDNRILRLSLGMSLGFLQHSSGLDTSKVLSIVSTESGLLLECIPCNGLPMGALISAGARHSNEIWEKVKTGAIAGDAPAPGSDDELASLMHEFSNAVRRWMNSRYERLLTHSRLGNEEAEQQFYATVQGYPVQAIALKIADEIDLKVPLPESEIIKTNLQNGD
jgi:hypothetical protein